MNLKTLWQRPDARFLILFLTILAIGFGVVALKWVNERVVDPYTEVVAQMSAGLLRLFGEEIVVSGCNLSGRFSVTIYNGCNGLITSLIFVSGVLAFPASLRAKLIGFLGGLVAIQLINLVRIISLFFIGVYFPKFFNQSHVVIWQSVIILAGVSLWVLWANRFAAPSQPAKAEGGQ